MESIRPYLDSLPKKSLDWLKENFEEGDRIYKYFGNTGGFGYIAVLMLANGKHGGLSYFYDHFITGKITETPTTLGMALHHMETGFEKIRQNVISRHCPLLIQDPIQRRLAIQEGEIINRYKLVKKNGEEYEILT